MTDGYLERLCAQMPDLADDLRAAFADQDARYAEEEWRRRHPKDPAAEEAARIRAVVEPMIMQAVARGMAVVKDDLRKEMRSLKRRANLRRWDRKEIDRYVNSLPRAPE
jgi:hypothetical protein